MLRSRTITALATVAATTAATFGVGLAASPADSATGYVGRVESNLGLVARSLPTPAAPREASYADDTRLDLVCKVHGVSIGGNDVWHLLRGEDRRWVSARYIDNVSSAPRVCGDGRHSAARVRTARVNRREAPTVRAAKDGVLTRNARVSIVCWVEGLSETVGDAKWYQLANGSWVSATYIGRTRPRVELCA